jgi:predicted nucleic-acid-binding protein
MTGVDTNILVRAVLEDSPEESALAKAFIKKACIQKNLFISCFAILEMVWVLKSQNRSRSQIAEAIWDLLDSPGIHVGNRTIVSKAVGKYIKGKADFGDYMILSEGELEGANLLVSFDKVFCKEESKVVFPQNFV